MVGHDRHNDEEIPLLQPKPRIPLPWGQINLIFLALVAEPLSSAYIFPFINQVCNIRSWGSLCLTFTRRYPHPFTWPPSPKKLISELGVTKGDDRRIGYYGGLIESLFFVTQALTTWQWSRLSDFIGRRPIILLGLLGLSVSNFAFGLSRTLGMLIFSRCIAGVLNGNVGVMKSMLGDITDHSNMAQVFSIIPPIFCLGLTIAPLYGGALTKPRDRWPNIFHGKFWETYPYFLPSFVSGIFTLLIFLVCAIFLKESLPSKANVNPQSKRPAVEDSPDHQAMDNAQPVPMLALIKTYSVMIPVANYGILALVEIACIVLLPLFYSSPTEIGGLGLPPSIIGTYLAIFGAVDGIVQVLFAARIIAWVGPKRLFCWAVLWYYPLILIFPIMSVAVIAQGKVGPVIWMLIVLQLISMVLADLSYSVIAIFTTRAAPNKRSLGSTNGLSQSLTSIARAIGPAMTTSLFALSKEYNVLGGNFVYVVLAVLTTVLVLLSRHLPELKDEK